MLIQIKNKRKERNVAIKELAHVIDVDSSLMSRMLAGKRPISEAQLIKIGEYLEMDMSDLLKRYLAEKVYSIVKEYPEIAQETLQVAEARVEFLVGDQKYNTIPIDEVLKQKLSQIDKLLKEWSKVKPLKGIQLEKMAEYFHTRYTHESNKIEGNTLTFQETHLVVNEGITIGGKSMREHLEAVNHKEAIALILDLAKNEASLNNHYLLSVHQLILKGIQPRDAGRYRNVQVRIGGSEHIPPEPYMIEKMMEDYFIFYNMKKDNIHPVLLAAEMHERLVSIHPFIDGNGRTSRLIMNLILIANGYTICNLKGDLSSRMKYYKALEQVQIHHDKSDFYHLIADHCLVSLKEHINLSK